MTAPSIPVSPKHVRVQRNAPCLRADSALGFGTGNWPRAHTPPVRGAHPAGSRNCHCGLTAGTPSCRPPPARGKPPPYSHLDTAHLLSLSPRPRKLFSLSQQLTYRYRPPVSQSPNKEPFVTIFAPGVLTQFLAFSCPLATQSSPVGKQSKPTEPPPRGGLRGGREEAAPSAACPAAGEFGRRRGGELPAR